MEARFVLRQVTMAMGVRGVRLRPTALASDLMLPEHSRIVTGVSEKVPQGMALAADKEKKQAVTTAQR